ncbi:hypothetical protein Tco_0879163 [Tanacetum coccineum]
MESVFRISNYATDFQVKFATCTLLDGALTWWNSHVKTLALLCPKMVPNEEEKIERVCAAATKDADNKRKWEDKKEGNHRQQQKKRQEVVKVYIARTGSKIGYAGT